MRDDPGQLDDEPEGRTGLPRPPPHHLPGPRPVDRRVRLDRVAPGRVLPQPLAGRDRLRQDPPLPRLVRPHRTPDVKPHLPTLSLAFRKHNVRNRPYRDAMTNNDY